MTARKAIPAKKAATDADDTRYDFRNMVACNADGSPRAGVTSPVGVSLVTSTATMNVAVAAFSAVAVRDGGVILLANDGTVNVLLDAAPVANSRYDVIYMKQNDSSSTVTTPDANDAPVITFAKGTAAPTPPKPSVPVGAVELATVLIPAGATATNSSSPAVVITQTAAFTSAPGAEVPFRTLTDLNGWTTPRPWQKATVFNDSANSGTYAWNSASSVWARQQSARLGRVRLGSATVISTASPDWMNILTLTANSIGGVCMVEVAANVYNPNSGDVRTAGLRVVCDGTQVDDIWQLDIPNPGGASAGVHGVVRAESTPGVGTHTWKFQANASVAASVSIRSAVMTVQEV